VKPTSIYFTLFLLIIKFFSTLSYLLNNLVFLWDKPLSFLKKERGWLVNPAGTELGAKLVPPRRGRHQVDVSL